MNQYTFLHENGNFTLTIGALSEFEAWGLLAAIPLHIASWKLDAVEEFDVVNA